LAALNCELSKLPHYIKVMIDVAAVQIVQRQNSRAALAIPIGIDALPANQQA
jgi:hypothetical protein